MTDLREIATRAVHDIQHGDGDFDRLRWRGVPIEMFSSLDIGDTVIAAIEPLIRASERERVFDALIENSIGDNWCALTIHQDTGSFGGGSEYVGTLADWLTERQEADRG